MDILNITQTPLSVDAITQEVTSETCGAISVFIGTTRNNFNGKKVIRLEYEAYDTMAEKEMKKICQTVRTKWPEVEKIAIHHRLGLVPLKEASVVIAVSSPHRQASLEAVHYIIDTLKATVPIWKKEVYEGEGDVAQWKENKECAWAGQK